MKTLRAFLFLLALSNRILEVSIVGKLVASFNACNVELELPFFVRSVARSLGEQVRISLSLVVSTAQ